MFKADEAVPKLEWDFTRYVPKAKGVAPEPTSEMLKEFQSSYSAMTESVRVKVSARVQLEATNDKSRSIEERRAEAERWNNMTLDEIEAEILDEASKVMTVADNEAYIQRLAELVAKVTEDCPSAEQIMALPGRVRAAFFGWIRGQLMSPESWTADTRN